MSEHLAPTPHKIGLKRLLKPVSTSVRGAPTVPGDVDTGLMAIALGGRSIEPCRIRGEHSCPAGGYSDAVALHSMGCGQCVSV